MKCSLYSLIFLLLPFFLSAQLLMHEEPLTLQTTTGDISGTLKVPVTGKPVPVVILIAGSGPTDRKGNQPGMQTNMLEMLADGLYKSQIATLCFDKRGVGASRAVLKSEFDLRFEHYIDDVKGWITLLAADKRISKVWIMGHSEGALIGLIASVKNPKVAGYISLAGMGRPMADLLKEQLNRQLVSQPAIKEQAFSYIDLLQKGETFSNVPAQLQSLFRPSVQPLLISVFRYNPQQEIAKLTVPILIVQGSTDIQVSVADADFLAKANPKAKKVILSNVNHVLKDCATTDQQIQMATYTNPSLPVNPGVIKAICDFIVK